MRAGGGAALAGITVVLLALVLATASWPVLGSLAQRTPLPPAAQWTDAGVPVPASAGRCAAQDGTDPGSVHWCMPAGVSAATVDRWYRDVLPPGRDAGGLRWCVEQRRTDSSRRVLWSTGAGLAGYVLPQQPPRPPTQELEDPVAVEVVVLPGGSCHPATRAGREEA
ncbi:hypothetical protein [Geodermatophilus obscurus]|uniref:hypothetical protein n=1 Tax=Geodermatophilus obscurus TaxID=1861 RepID=UPI0002E4800D|nr:hypothetical protein [Geodermatophilus obscurus]